MLRASGLCPRALPSALTRPCLNVLPSALRTQSAASVFLKARPLSTLTTLRFSDEVKSALESKKPLVALESTIISHGMPYPQNYETAIEVEKVVRDNGAVPATIAIIDGQIQIGLSPDQIRHLAKLGRSAVKASRRDLAVVMAKKQTGATTVSSTMLLAHRAGISVFATGGIGGVHRGYENTMDASADLTELGRTPVAVVCAGVKSILDIGRTLEFLETQGVTVATYGSTPDFPAFFTRTSGFKSMLNIETPTEAAELIAANHSIDLQSGIVVAVPIPEADAMDDALVGDAINMAVKEADEQKIYGKESTPFLLKRVNELTGGNSLKSTLVKQNASVAAKIAKSLAGLGVQSGSQTRSYSTSARRMKQHEASQGRIMVIGGTVVDITATAHDATSDSLLNSSFPGTTRISLGGVGRNVAEGVSKLNAGSCVFVSAVGGREENLKDALLEGTDNASDDLFGPWLIDEVDRRGLSDLEIHMVPGARTATYTAIHDSTGNLFSAIADMDVFELLPPSMVESAIIKHKPRTICFDGNISTDCMRTILETSRQHNIQTFFEPTSVAKCARPLDSSMLDVLLSGALRFASPNEYELQKMATHARKLITDHKDKSNVRLKCLRDRPIQEGLLDPEDVEVNKDDNMAYRGLLLDAFSVSQFIPTLFIKLGPKGVVVVQRTCSGSLKDGQEHNPSGLKKNGMPKWQPYAAHQTSDIKSVTGAGDSFVASVVTSLHHFDKAQASAIAAAPFSKDVEDTKRDDGELWKHMDQIIMDAQTAATLTMQTHETVSPALAKSPQAKRLRWTMY
ncbi:hypothetical protein EDD11_000316 [Mortierella claussenii]|nr:hypothetical protein EDD11_000316 [Mortierella claussenii]